MARFRLAPLVLLCIADTAAAQVTEPWEAPTLSVTRYDEDWSDLADNGKRAQHWTGRFKYIRLGDDAWLSTGIEIRVRREMFNNNLWGGGPAPDDGYTWYRVLPYADLHVGDVRVFAQPVAAFASGVAPAASPVDQTRFDLLQGFGEVAVGPVVLRAGRQMLSLGSERLVGTRYGPNLPLAFDGVRGIVSVGQQRATIFAARPVTPGGRSFDDKSSTTKTLWGLYATRPGLDLYYIGFRNSAGHFGSTHGRETRHSIGIRAFGSRNEWHWNVEGVAQFGTFTGHRIAAWTLGSEVGRRLSRLPLSPDATLRFDVVSGDTNASDHILGTFNALFPKGKYFGELSPVGPYNIININPRISAPLGRGFSASAAAMAYWRYSSADGVYDVAGSLIRAAGHSRARFIGKEAEVAIAWQATAELELSSSFSLFGPGAFIRDTGPARTIRMIGLEANFRL